MSLEEAQVKSKERVTDHGEVFTNKREVNAMLVEKTVKLTTTFQSKLTIDFGAN